MPRREVREDQHGTKTGYTYGCRCDSCRAAVAEYGRKWRRLRDPGARLEVERHYRDANAQKIADRNRAWKAENRDYTSAYRRRLAAKYQADSRPQATRTWKHYQPHEDALLARVASNIAAASALARTPKSIAYRREVLRKKGLL